MRKSALLLITLTFSVAPPCTQAQSAQARAGERVESGAVLRGIKYEPKILEVGRRYGVDPRLIWIVGYLETRFRPGSVSRVNAGGLMQIMPATAKLLGVNPFNTDEAIEGAGKYLALLGRLFNNDPALMLAGYNAGEAAVICFRDGTSKTLPSGKVINPRRIRTGGVPPYQETRDYVAGGLGLLKAMGAVEFEAAEGIETAEAAADPGEGVSLVVGLDEKSGKAQPRPTRKLSYVIEQ